MKRLFFVFAGFLFAISCGWPTKNNLGSPSGVLIVGNKSGNDVYFLDRISGDILAKLSTGLEPHEVEVSCDGRIAVISNYGNRENPGNTLSVYDVLNARLIRTIDLGQHTRPHGMHWLAGTGKLLVTAEGSRSLLVVDTENGQVLQALYTGLDVSHMVAATPDGVRAFVSSIRTGNVTVFDLITGELLYQVYSGLGAEGIGVSPDGKEVWVTNRAENTIAVFDTQSLERLATIACEDFPIRGRFSPNGKMFLVSNARSGTVAVFDTATRIRLADIKMTSPVPDAEDPERYFADFAETSVPIGLVVPDNQFAYVANTRSDVVSVISLITFEIIDHFVAGKEPDGINFSPLRPRLK